MTPTTPSGLSRDLSRRALPLTVALRRGGTTLPAQAFDLRIPGASLGRRRQSEGSEASAGAPQLIGAHDADVAPGDRFTLGEAVYVVRLVHPDRSAHTTCDLELSQ